jgi:hypothetical protein
VKRRALLLSGGVNRDLDRSWYAHDIAAFHDLLVTVHGYGEADVRVCMGSGGSRPLAGGRVAPVEPARRDPVLSALRWLAELQECDRAFVMVTDHGDEEGISLWGKSQILTPGKLVELLGPSPATKVIVLGQCFAGCFGTCQLGRAVVCCACGPAELSYPRPRAAPGVEPTHSEFLYQLAGALGGRYPDGARLQDPDLPPPDRISIGEAFRYARAHDHWITGTRSVSELPRMFDPAGIADQIALWRPPLQR